MSRSLIWGLALLLPLSAARAQDNEKKDSAAAEAVKTLKKEAQAQQQKIIQRYSAEKDEKAKEAILEEYYAVPGAFADRFLKVAKESPKDPAAEEALALICTMPGKGPKFEAALGTALGMLIERDPPSKQLPRIFAALERSDAASLAEPLRNAYLKGPDAVRAKAGLALAGNLRLRGEKAFQDKKDSQALYAEAEKILTAMTDDETNGKRAKDMMFELKNLTVGKKAPDIDGEDVQGGKLTVSTHRGKVVTLCFWGKWCPPCRAMIPHERELVKRLEGKPFQLIGINSDKDRDEAKTFMAKEEMNWPSFWNGGSTRGPISTEWKVSFWPTIYVLDGDGIIRYRNVRGPALDAAVDTLLKEMARKK